MKVFGRHKVLDHDGDTKPLVPGPVRNLALPATVGDGETLGALLDAVSSLVTPHTGQKIPVYLGHLEASLYASNANVGFSIQNRKLTRVESGTTYI